MTTTTTTTDAAVAIYEVTVGDRHAYVRAANGAEAITKYVRATYRRGVARSFQTYEAELGGVETHAKLHISRLSYDIYATPITILD